MKEDYPQGELGVQHEGTKRDRREQWNGKFKNTNNWKYEKKNITLLMLKLMLGNSSSHTGELVARGKLERMQCWCLEFL